MSVVVAAMPLRGFLPPTNKKVGRPIHLNFWKWLEFLKVSSTLLHINEGVVVALPSRGFLPLTTKKVGRPIHQFVIKKEKQGVKWMSQSTRSSENLMGCSSECRLKQPKSSHYNTSIFSSSERVVTGNNFWLTVEGLARFDANLSL